MSGQHPSVETFLKHVRKETHELADQMTDSRERARLYAFVAAALVSKVIESLPEMTLTDASEARDLMEEARETLRGILEALRDLRGAERPGGVSREPSLN